MERVIFHVDVNSAYLSWEAVYRIQHLGAGKDLRECMAAVAGDAALRRGIILAKSIPAARCGVCTGDTVFEARQKCPELMLVPPNYHLYETCSAALFRILRTYTEYVEPYSIDEAFLDMSSTRELWGDPIHAAEQMAGEIRETLGFTVNIGISSNRVLAKMASDFTKPDRIHTLWKEEIREKMWKLPAEKLFFVGNAARKKLYLLGIRTIGELAAADERLLRLHLKKQGEIIWRFANGIDESIVAAETPPNKGYGNSTTIPFDVTDEKTANLVLLALCETLAARLRADGVSAGAAAVEMKTDNFVCSRRQKVLLERTDSTRELYEAAVRIFRELWNGEPIRHLGVHAGKISRAPQMHQISLFEEQDSEKQRQLDRAVDAVRARYGMDAVKRAAFLQSPIDHMSGGISREKWKPDYRALGLL